MPNLPDRRLPRGITLLPGLVALAATALGLAIGGGASDWNATHWLFSYDLEFVRRGLPGSAAGSLIASDPVWIERLSLGVLGLLGVVVLAFAARAFGKRARAGLGLALLLAASPAIFSQWGYDCGRFDQLNGILFLASVLPVLAGKRWAILWAMALTVTAILIHEAYLVIHLPLVVALVAYRGQGNRPRAAIVMALVGILAWTVTWRAGNLDSMDSTSYEQQLLEAHTLNPRDVHWSSGVLFRPLARTMAYSTRTLPRRLLDPRALAGMVLLLPWFWIPLRWLRQFPHAGGGGPPGLLIAAAFSPLALFVVGSDAFRWIALANFNVFAAVLMWTWIHPEHPVRPLLPWKWLVALVVLGLLIGPFGVDRPLPGFGSGFPPLPLSAIGAP